MTKQNSTIEFLSYLRSLDVRLNLEDGRLVCTAPKGVLSPELAAELKARKPQIIEALKDRAHGNALPPIVSVAREAYMTPSTRQQELWFLEQLDPESAAYNIIGCVLLNGSLDRDAMERSLKEIVQRHEILRTSIVNIDGVPKAVIRSVDFKMEVRSFLDVAKESRIAELQALASAEARRRIDLSTAPLLRGCLAMLGENRHALLITIHHIAADGWSLGVFGKELVEIYEAFRSGLPSPLPELPFQYADYAQWHHDYVEEGAAPAQIPYWKEQFRGSLPPGEFPSDRLRPALMTFKGTRLCQKLPGSLGDSLRKFSVAEGVTPFMAALAAFKILMFRYTHEPDVIVGSASAGRSRSELEHLIGLFMNTLALRTQLGGDPTVRELLGRVRETALNASAHQDVTFERLMAAIQPPRELNRSPLFQVMFIFQNFPLKKVELPGLAIEPVQFDAGVSRYDLTVEVGEDNNQLALDWEYSTDLFDSATIERLQRHYATLLEQVISHPERRISELSLLSKGERREVLEGWNGTERDYDRRRTVVGWLEETAARCGERTAVVYGSKRLSYAELSARSNRLARRLRELGVGRDGLVGLCVERSEEMVVAVLGVLKAGGAYVPLDPEYPRERLRFMLEDSGAKVLITEAGLLEAVSSKGLKVVCLDRDREWIEAAGDAPLEETAGPENLAYVIYTSGSTGKPKGVEIGHGSVVNFLESMQREPGMTERDRLLAVTTLSFDIAGLELYLPLVTGAEVTIAPRAAAGDGAALARLWKESGATTMQATPVTWRLLLESGWESAAGMKILCGGEALPRELANRLVAGGGEVWNLYGPTETTIWSTVERVEAGEGGVGIGKPVANTQVYVLDERREPVPVGVTGELYIGGEGLARGYLGRPELTRERFVANPFREGERMYRTGDLARWRAGGRLEYLGRADQQVKLRGHRIELGEIEACLEEMGEVRQAVVVVRNNAAGIERLVAYVVPEKGRALDPKAARQALQAQLPEYMIPSAFVSLDKLPLTPNNKIDRKALPEPDGAGSVTAPYAPPRTEAEQIVAQIWQDLLQNPRVGIHDNFFDLGGHSLLIVQVQNRLRRRFGFEVSLVSLFQHPNVALLARLIENNLANQGTAVAVGS